MNKAKWLVGFLGALSILNAPNVLAENKTGATTFTLGTAYYHFSPRRHINHTGMFDVALDYNATERWAIEGFFGNASSTRHDGTNVHDMLYLLDGIYRLAPKGNWQPYVSFGVGVMDLKPTVNTDNQFSGNLNGGIGVQYFIHKMIAFRGEAKDLYATSGGKNDVMVNVGVSLLFGNDG